MSDRFAIFLFACVMLALAAFAPLPSADARTPAPNIADVDPDWVNVADGSRIAHVPARICRKVSDVHAYNVNGRALRQFVDPAAGPYWVNRKGRALVGFDRANCDFYGFTRTPVIVAAFIEQTGNR